ncbi:MAG: isoprenylcysteine carboxylmethyltransferase family protein [Gammaproteobacteria bacterium]
MPDTDRANVIAPPPIIFAVSILIGSLLDKVVPLGAWKISGTIPGVLLIGTGILLAATCIRYFRKAGTTANPYSATEAISSSGPYRFSRNPMYLSLGLIQLGISLLLNSVWVMVMILPALIVLHYGVILREERYLEAKFTDQYRQYKNRVRRWF